jgi:hypothetical protein
MSCADIIRATMKQKKEEQDEEQGNSKHISRCMTFECADTLIQYMGHWDSEYNITARKKIRSVVRNVNNRSKSHSKLPTA